jgi:hypothetical protein
VGEVGKERKLIPRDPGKGFIPKELCGLKGIKDKGNIVPDCSLPEIIAHKCPAFASPGYKHCWF